MAEFIIPICISDIQNIYSELDPDGLSFSSDLRDYLTDYIEDRRFGEKICVEVRSEDNIDMEHFRKAFLLFVDKLSRRNRRDVLRNNISAVRLLLIGIVFIIIGILSASHMGAVLAAIISTVGSFSVWEASSVWIEILPALRKKERLLKIFSDTEFRYVRLNPCNSSENETTDIV